MVTVSVEDLLLVLQGLLSCIRLLSLFVAAIVDVGKYLCRGLIGRVGSFW